MVMSVKQKHLTSGCKRYYEYLTKLYKASSINNWKIINGKYKNYNFVIAKDDYVAKQLGISIQSIYNYKKTLKSLGLINTLPKFTTRTNQFKNKHFCQLTVILKTIPKWLISKTLVFKNSIKNARILKTSSNIISQFKQNLNNTVRNIHTKIKNLLNTVTTTNYTNNTSYNNLNKEDVQTVANILNTYNIKFKNNEIPHYIEMNWKIINGKYKNYNFVIAKDDYVAKQLGISIQSIYNYKKTLKSLGLINTLPKFTTRTNQFKNKHFCQLTVILKTIPKWLISKTLVFKNSIKNARILKTSSNIISQFKQNLNNTVRNIHTKIKNLLNTVTTTNYTNNTSYNNLNKEDVQTVANILNTYNIKFKNNEIPHYIEMYEKSKEKFNQTCKYCNDKYMYAPLKYFTDK